MAVSLVFIAASCNKPMNSDDNGRLMIKVTDGPFDISNIESATVTINKVEIKKVGDCISDGSSWVILSEDAVTLDLIDLRNGVTETLIDIEVPAGEYDMLRLYVDEAGLTVKEIESPFIVKVPSGSQTGIKIHVDPALEVSGALTEELLLDIDLSRSFVLRGNMDNNNGFIFKPVIRAANLSTAGRIEGTVTDDSEVAIAGVEVSIMQEETVVATATSDEQGYYAIIGVPAGTYTITAVKEGYETVTIDDMIIKAGNKLVQDFTLTPPPAEG